MKPFIEIVKFRTNLGVTNEEFIEAAMAVNDFLKAQSGFLSRQLGHTSENEWYDIVFWEDEQSFMAAAEKASTSSQCEPFFRQIDANNDSMIFLQSKISA